MGLQQSHPLSSATSLAGISLSTWPRAAGVGRACRTARRSLFALEHASRRLQHRHHRRRCLPVCALAEEAAIRIARLHGCGDSHALLHASSVGDVFGHHQSGPRHVAPAADRAVQPRVDDRTRHRQVPADRDFQLLRDLHRLRAIPGICHPADPGARCLSIGKKRPSHCLVANCRLLSLDCLHSLLFRSLRLEPRLPRVHPFPSRRVPRIRKHDVVGFSRRPRLLPFHGHRRGRAGRFHRGRRRPTPAVFCCLPTNGT